MKPHQKKILLALDGSEQGMNAARYAASFLSPADNKVVLYHVMSKVPEAFRDLGINSDLHGGSPLQEWAAQQERDREKFMEIGRCVFLDAGFPSGAIEVKVEKLVEGFARDIAAESLRGYDAVILGRKGLNPLQDAVLGSIATKVATRLCRIPVWLVGGAPPPGKVLIAVDSSLSAMLSVIHAGKMLNGTTTEVKLLHVVRSMGSLLNGYQHVIMGEYLDKLVQEAESKILPIFDKATEHITGLGISADRVFSKVISGVNSRAGAILKEADDGGYGTIVAGRMGLTRVENYDMGRVTFKLLQMAKDKAVWIVGKC